MQSQEIRFFSQQQVSCIFWSSNGKFDLVGNEELICREDVIKKDQETTGERSRMKSVENML